SSVIGGIVQGSNHSLSLIKLSSKLAITKSSRPNLQMKTKRQSRVIKTLIGMGTFDSIESNSTYKYSIDKHSHHWHGTCNSKK
ncbi:hypothetical protein AB4224_16035, partial [Vibrio lentus]